MTGHRSVSGLAVASQLIACSTDHKLVCMAGCCNWQEPRLPTTTDTTPATNRCDTVKAAVSRWPRDHPVCSQIVRDSLKASGSYYTTTILI